MRLLAVALFVLSGSGSQADEPKFADTNQAKTWHWLLKRAGKKQHVERDGEGRVKWVGFLDEEKQRGDYYTGSLDLDADGNVVKATFNGPNFTNDDLQRFAALKHLRVLTSWHNGWVKDDDKSPYSGAGLSHLKSLPLEEVNFGGSWFNDEGMAAANQLPKLRVLEAYHTRVTNVGVKALRENASIRKLTLGPQYSQKITAETLSDIATMKALEELEFNEMLLPWTNGLESLMALKGQLKRVKFDQGFANADDLERLRKALPEIEITYIEAKLEHVKQMQEAENSKK